jgi:acetate kinase
VRVLCFDVGSSSVKYAAYDVGDGERLLARENLSDRGTTAELLERIAAKLAAARLQQFDAIGQRIVFGGAARSAPAVYDRALRAELEAAAPLFPLHLRPQLDAIDFVERQYRDTPQVLCFDTAFFAALPKIATRFPLPESVGPEVRRYGFHGISYEYIASQYDVARRGRVVAAHLGSGASLCALRDGVPLDTTMGISPLGGIMMGTRPGDLDPGVLLYLLGAGWNPERLGRTLNEESGLLGVSGSTSDMRALTEQYDSNPRAADAVDLFAYVATKHAGALIAVLGGIDTLIFTGGIGEHAPLVRAKICERLGFAGVALDPRRNEAGEQRISPEGSRAGVFALPTDENLTIARHVFHTLHTRRASS